MKRVILYGGSFDPIHNGHLEIAKQAIKQRHAHELWFLISKRSPFKDNPTSFKHRYVMCKLMTQYHRKFKLCTIEKDMPDPSYTIDTITVLKKQYPHIQFEFLIGSDQLETLPKWKNWEQIETEVTVLCYEREKGVKHNFIPIKGPVIDISSTMIREGISLQTNPKVIRYMTWHSLYTKRWLEVRLSEHRFNHVMRVTELINELGTNYYPETNLCGLFHDFNKELDKSVQYEMMKATGYNIDLPPYFYHAFTAASILAKHYYIRDKDILRAIRGHVNGDSTNVLGKLLFVADKCERGRDYDSEPLIELSKRNLNKGFKECLINQEKYLKEKENVERISN